MLLFRVIAMWLTSLLLSLAVPTGVSVAASPVAQSPIYTYDNTHISSVTADAAAERGPPASPDRQITYYAVDLGSHGTSARPNEAAVGSTTTYTASDEFIQVARTMGTTQRRSQGDGGALSAPSEFWVATKPEVPLIKAGSQGGSTAGKRFPQSVKDDVLLDNPSTCVYCRMETDRPQIDHVIPRSRGANATLENAQTTCAWCNASKGARDFPVNPPPGYRGAWPPDWW